MSKVFVGIVNGEKFDNEKDFQVAVAKAMFAGGELNISSCYRYNGECECDENCSCHNQKQVEENNTPIKITKSELEPDESYQISKELISKLNSNPENLDEIRDFVSKSIESSRDEFSKYSIQLKKLNEEYQNLKCKIKHVEDDMKFTRDHWDYYKTLSQYIPTNSGCTCNDGCECLQKEINDSELSTKTISTFGDFLNFLGFI